MPTLTTVAASNITQTTATSGGNVTSTGNGVITERGICYSTNQNPTTADSKITSTGTTGTYTCNFSGLTIFTTYYVRAYLINAGGTNYGIQVSFITLANLPTVTTNIAANISYTSATTGGNVTDNGGGTITERGVCYAITQNPTTANSKVTVTGTTGIFTCSITGLTDNTTYYLRAYTTNSGGTSYGAQENFTTLDIIAPTIETTAITNINYTTATGGGNVTNDNGATVTTRGICYSTSQNPTTANSIVTATGTTGIFTCNLTGLTDNTIYYIRAFATNSIGTSYGTQVNFTTLTAPTSVTDYDGNVYDVVLIGTQIWMAENLKTTHYSDGTAITNIPDNAAWHLAGEAYCWYNNDAVTYKNIYGALYNWKAVAPTSNGNKNLCPVGWHVPTDTEWTTLTTFITNDGYSGIEGTALKATSGWNSGGNGTDNYGFEALPGGYRRASNGTFYNVGDACYWWSSTAYDESYAWLRFIYYNPDNVYRASDYKLTGLSVRCLKDN